MFFGKGFIADKFAFSLVLIENVKSIFAHVVLQFSMKHRDLLTLKLIQ